MRHLTVQDAFRRVAEGSFICRNPAPKPKRKYVDGADEPDEQEDESPGDTAGWRRRGAGSLAVGRGCSCHAFDGNRLTDSNTSLSATGAYGSKASTSDISS